MRQIVFVLGGLSAFFATGALADSIVETQSGSRNYAVINDGSGNAIDLSQRGGTNTTSDDQTGTNNSVWIVQRGRSNTASVTQTGQTNNSVVDQGAGRGGNTNSLSYQTQKVVGPTGTSYVTSYGNNGSNYLYISDNANQAQTATFGRTH